MEVNGKFYPLWGQFVERKKEWIGGKLQDFGDTMDSVLGLPEIAETTITDIKLEPNGDDSAFFSVVGADYICGFDVKHGGIAPVADQNWLTFSGYGGHKWRVMKNNHSLPGQKGKSS